MDSRITSTTSSGGSSADAGTAVKGGTGASTATTRVPARSSSLTSQDVGGAATTATQQVMKCPRCDSLNTKFCYFNNYSQTQPRHFCKNCRRYWTAGGALRNVPVGGGCRKNKRVSKQRPFINLGVAAAGLLDPSSLIDDTTSNMLARLSSNTSPFPNFSCGLGTSSFGDDTSTQLLNIAFSRFQQSMRLRHQQQSSDQSPETAPYFDMSFPALVHKPSAPLTSCSCGGACGSRGHSVHHGNSCNGMMNTFEGSFGFAASLPVKMEHDVTMAGFCTSGYELNPSMYHDEQSANMHMVVDTSATATLASIEDQLSSFSNLHHVDALEEKGDPNIEGTSKRSMVSGPLQLLGQTDEDEDDGVETKEQLMHYMNDKPLLNMMPTDHSSSWQQPSLFMSEMLLEPHHNIWNAQYAARWQDNMQHPLAAATPATAGSVL